MSNLGFLTIYTVLNNRDDTVCERVFLPDLEDIQEYKRTGQELISYESKTALNEFDILAFSISFENDYPNIVKILNLSNIPIYSSLRDKKYPLLIAGGICATSNPEPFADIFDIIFIGEAENTINRFVEKYLSSPRDILKKEIIDICGIYVPEFYNYSEGSPHDKIYHKAPLPVQKTHNKEFSRVIINPIIKSSNSEFGHMSLFEVMRGCNWRCRFCLVSSIYNPSRLRDKGLLECEIDKVDTKVGLIAPSLSDVHYIAKLISRENVRFSITSLRASKNSKILIESLRDKKSLSIAPETGTEKMRKIINKRITEEDILSTANYAFDSGIEILKLYFMIGLPNESHDDIEGIIVLVKKITAMNNKAKVSVTLNPFVPKPFTPFQWHRFEDLKTLKDKINFIKRGLYEMSMVSVNDESPRYAFMQAAFARGGRETLKNIIEISLSDNLKAVLKDKILKKKVLTSWQYDTPLPWDLINIGVSKYQLWQEYQEALKH